MAWPTPTPRPAELPSSRVTAFPKNCVDEACDHDVQFELVHPQVENRLNTQLPVSDGAVRRVESETRAGAATARRRSGSLGRRTSTQGPSFPGWETRRGAAGEARILPLFATCNGRGLITGECFLDTPPFSSRSAMTAGGRRDNLIPRMVLRGSGGWRAMRNAGFWDMPLTSSSGIVLRPVRGQRADTTPARFVSDVDI